jgi:hypothetical protein
MLRSPAILKWINLIPDSWNKLNGFPSFYLILVKMVLDVESKHSRKEILLPKSLASLIPNASREMPPTKPQRKKLAKSPKLSISTFTPLTLDLPPVHKASSLSLKEAATCCSALLSPSSCCSFSA